jgi:DNA (cytosine-5)-methyltransferase 1
MVDLKDKPPYRVPSMAEINALPWNGFKVASTFSGCGGSCLGYRMAGFRVVWANEFVPAAQASYNANKTDDCYLDYRDIKTVLPEEILERIGLNKGELDLFDGSPPCQSFSTAGKREKGWGHAKTYEHGAKQCNETLFAEYIRILRGLMPKTFVAENVSGLVKGTAKGMFLEILAALKASGYRVTCRILDAQWLGVPQMRQRTIFVGVREDLRLDPVHPKPLAYRYSVRDALPWIAGRSELHGFAKENEVMDKERPSPAIMASGAAQQRIEVIEPETDISRYAIGKEWDKLKPGEQSAKYFSCVKVDAEQPCNSIMASSGGHPSAAQPLHPTEKRKFTIAELKRICAFSDDFVLCGSYAQMWERLGNSVPPTMMFHVARTIADEIFQQRSGGFRYDVANGWIPA